MITIHSLKTRSTWRLVAVALLLGTGSAPAGTPARASDREAAAQVRLGVRLHQAGDFEQAAQAFAKAAKSLPAEPRIAFDQGCALAAQGKYEEAESRLRDAALARDPGLAAAAYYNLGCLAADQMKTLFGDQPEEAVDETRVNGLQLVRTAVDHYRNALRANPEHAAARRNLELLRIWSKHIQDRWAQRDRQRRREQMNLLEFLAWLSEQQRGTRGLAKALPEKLDSPTQRQDARKLAATQRDLTLEIEPLKVKLDQALQPPADAATPGASPATPATTPQQALSPQLQQARKALHGLADQAGHAMSRAADELAHRNVTAAIAAQTEVLPPLNQLFELLAPFEAILQAAIKSETALVATSTQAANGRSASPTGGTMQADFESAAEDQQFVSGWSRMLIRKAEQLLAEAAAAPADDTGSPTEIPLPTSQEDAATSAPKVTSAPKETSEPNEPSAPKETAEGSSQTAASIPAGEPVAPHADPQAAYQKTIELGPRIVKLTSEAAAGLRRQAWSDALPKQEEALKLLKEIAALLPPQEQQDQDQEQQDKENQEDQEKQDQKKQDQEKQDQKKQDRDQDKSSDDAKKKKQDQDQDKTDSKQKDDAEQKKSDQEKSRGKQQPQDKLSRQQAESLLRQVREREREHREFEKEIRRLLQSRIIVEKDW